MALRPVILALALCALATGAAAQVGVGRTHLLDLQAGSGRSDLVRDIRRGGYELAGGGAVAFRDWYTPDLPDLTLVLLTQLTDGFALTWGVSTGEAGRKYRIAPALHIGFVAQTELWANATLTLSAQTLIGGGLRERSCLADYGPFGMAEVNCRLAATPLPPDETLRYLMDVPGRDDSRISLRFDYRF